MKKICLAAAVVLFTLLLAGCGKKQTLSCSQAPEGVEVVFNVDFKGNVVTGMDFHYNVDLSGYTDEQIESIGKQDFCVTVKESMSNYKEAFTDCKSSIADKHLKVDSILDVDKVATDEKDKMTSIDAAKTELEKQGYACVIK